MMYCSGVLVPVVGAGRIDTFWSRVLLDDRGSVPHLGTLQQAIGDAVCVNAGAPTLPLSGSLCEVLHCGVGDYSHSCAIAMSF